MAERPEPFESSPFGNVTRQTAYQLALEKIRHGILGGVLAPGTRLVIADLSRSLQVSTTPIREAFKRLAAEGLIDLDSFRSATVHEPTLKEARELMEMLLVLEPLAIDKAVQLISDEELARAAAIERELAATKDVARWVELNRDFHGILLTAADSPRLIQTVTALRDAAAIQVSLSIRADPSRIERSQRDHAAIIEAFRARDPERAIELTRQHLRATRQIVETYLLARDGGPPAATPSR